MLYKGFNMTVAHATQKDNPLDGKTVGTILCFHPKYALGHRHNFESLPEAQKMVKVTKAIWLPIFLKEYEDNQIAITTIAPFSTKLIEVGLIYINAVNARKFADMERIGNDVKRTVEAELVKEVADYNAYLQKDKFSLTISLPSGKELDRMDDLTTADLAHNIGRRLIDKYVETPALMNGTH